MATDIYIYIYIYNDIYIIYIICYYIIYRLYILFIIYIIYYIIYIFCFGQKALRPTVHMVRIQFTPARGCAPEEVGLFRGPPFVIDEEVGLYSGQLPRAPVLAFGLYNSVQESRKDRAM